MITTLRAHRRIDPGGAVRRRPLRSLALAVVAALVATFGAVTLAAPATAASGPTVAVTEAPAEGGTVTVTGTGFADPVVGIYLKVAAAGAADFSAAGSGDTVWIAEGLPDESGERGRTAPMAADGSFSVTMTVPAPTAGVPAYAVYTRFGHGGSAVQNATITNITFASEPEPEPDPEPEPAPEPEGPPTAGDHVVTVAVKSGAATITGSGFAQYAARDGLYVSLSRAGLSGIAAAQADSAKVADFWATTSGRYGATLTADGAFTITTDFAPEVGVDYAVYVADVNGHRPIDLLSVPVTVPTGGSGGSDGQTPSTPPAPTTGGGSVSGPSTSGPAAGNARPGEQLTITAGGFAPHETGIVLELHSDPVVVATGLTADAAGVVSYTFTVPAGTPAGQHTLVLKGATHTANVPLAVAEPLPVCVARVVSGATVTWGVKADFRSYVTGSVANGTIRTSGVSGNGPWTWSGGSGTFNTVDTVGRASFSGGVTFTGHGGVLDVEVSNLRVQVSTPSSGTLIGDLRTGTTNRSGVALASLNLAAGSRSASGTQVSWSGAPATLTSAGAAGFEGFYTAGTAMDAVSFTMPLGAETACTSTSGANAGKYLANTGADLDLAGLALLLLLGGGLMVLVARRVPRQVTARTPVPTQG